MGRPGRYAPEVRPFAAAPADPGNASNRPRVTTSISAFSLLGWSEPELDRSAQGAACLGLDISLFSGRSMARAL